MTDPSRILSVAFLICFVGGMVIWWWNTRELRREAEQTEWWDRHLTPNKNASLMDHTPPDTLTQAPLRPEDYPT